MKCKGWVLLLLLWPGFQFAMAQCPAINTASVAYTHVTCYQGSNGAIQPTFAGGTQPYTYSWSPTGRTSRTISGIPAGTYTVTVTDANGCQGIKSFTVNEDLAAGPTAADVTVCKGDKAILTASGTAADGSYRWYTTATGTTPITNETASTFTTPTKIKATATWYVSKVTAAGCESRRTAVMAKMINPLYPMVDLDSAMIMHYKFDNNLKDSTGRNGEAAVFQRTSFVADRNTKPASAIRLQVVDDMMDDYGYVNFPASNDLQALTDKITISFWMTRNTALGVIAPLLNKWQGGTGFFIGTITTNTTTLERKIYWKIGSAVMTSNAAIPSTDNIWHHVVCLYDGSQLQVYQNGVFAGSVPHTGNIPITSANMRMGRLADDSNGSRFTGRVDELRVYNRVLSVEEIRTLHNNESVAFSNSPLCEGSPVTFSTFAVPGATYQWDGPAQFASLQQNPVATNATLGHAGLYGLSVSKNGCTSQHRTSVIVRALPSTTISPSGPATFCEGQNVTLTAPNGSSWLWSTGATTQSIVVNQSNNYTVQVTNSHGCFKTSDPFPVTVTPINDAPSFTKGGDAVLNEDAPAQAINAWATAISAGPAETSQTLTFNVSNDNNALFSAQPTLTAAGNLAYKVAPNASGSARVTLSLSDNGGTDCGGVDRSPEQSFTITVNPVNDQPSFTMVGSLMTVEDLQPTPFAMARNISAGAANESGQALTFSVSNSNNDLFSVQPAISPAGILTYTLAQDKYGSATVTVSLKDDGGTSNGGIDQSADRTFTMIVSSLNDEPSFTKGADIAIDEDESAQSYSSWATNISPGPADEAAQTVSFTVTNDNNGLFSVQPSVSPSGELTFTPAPDQYGVANITVYLSDNGGTTLGGRDRSDDQTFTITINPVNDKPSFTKGNDIAVDEDAAEQTISAWATGISAGANEAVQIVSFQLSNDNNALFSVQPAVNASGDLTFTPAANTSGTAHVTLAVKDNGGTANGGDDQSDDQTFTITVNAVNDVPSFTPGRNVVVNEDAGAQNIHAWASGVSAGATEVQALNFIVSNDNNALFSVQPSVDVSGDLTFTPAADVAGITIVTIYLKDDGGTANGGVDKTPGHTFTIEINPVNDAPSFTKGASLTVDEGDPAQIVSGWATNIDAGANEASQRVSFQVSSDLPGLFDIQPSVSASGDLTFTPAAEASGVATVTVSLRDNGGTSDGGVDRSADQVFTITVNGINDAPSFNRGSDITIYEDAPAYSAQWATNVSAGDPGQVVSFVVSVSNPALFDAGPAVDASGILSFQVKPDVSGSSTVTVYVTDNGGTVSGGISQSASETFNITIIPVNDTPRIDPVDDITIPVNSQPVVVVLTGIHPGVGEEAQMLDLEVSSDNTSALAGWQLTPLHDGTTSLTLSPSAGFAGVVTITVRIKDSGGTTSGGIDETTVSFVLAIEPEIETIFLPNFFSPDNTAVNDVFRVRGAGIAQIDFRIYSIEGHELFSTTDIAVATEKGWDGRYKGQEMPAGTYTWTLQGKYLNGQPLTNGKNRYGQVLLMR